MQVSVLVEDTSIDAHFPCEHGLSLHLQSQQTNPQRILFDTGKTNLFLLNAQTLGIDLSKVQCAILSHGHYDHSGGMAQFLQINSQAPVFIHTHAADEHLALRLHGQMDNIGIDPSLATNPRLRWVEGDIQIGEGLFLFSSISGTQSLADSNRVLLCKQEGKLIPDPFLHEQSLLITEAGKRILIAGCAHRGIVNIIQRALELAGAPLDVVIGGFHLSNPTAGSSESTKNLYDIAQTLLRWPTIYYTGHCTGSTAYTQLKSWMHDRLHAIHSGCQFEI